MHYLGIDAGASATKWALINELGVVKSGVDASMDGHLYRDTSKIRMDSVLNKISEEISGKKVDRIYMGITGVVHDGSIEKYLEKYFMAPSIVVSDIELAYRANFVQGDGILLYAGTGSVAYAIDEKGEIHQIGGWGYLLGDEGAGYWIGREAIRQALHLIESKEVASSGSLVDLILKEINANDWNSVKSFVYSQNRSAIAALSKVVDQAALKGDKSAIEILNRAAGCLADLVERTDRSLLRKSLPIKFTGGISSSVSLYRELEKILKVRVSISTVDIALRAAELAGS
jgi:glucosamine kinase